MSYIQLTTTYNGKPAPGGVFDTDTNTYLKICRARNAGFHPYRRDVGGIDAPVIEYLKEHNCVQIEIHNAAGVFCISFADFLKYGYSQKWKDTRFQDARHYCPAKFWNAETPVKEEAVTTPEPSQACLFDNAALQDVAMKSRWA